jgi:Holliday junction resolvase RusA-like endonuclease
MTPRSLQSDPRLKSEVRSQMQGWVQQYPFLLSGDVEVRITWLVKERDRYFGVHSPDVDNILRPKTECPT